MEQYQSWTGLSRELHPDITEAVWGHPERTEQKKPGELLLKTAEGQQKKAT